MQGISREPGSLLSWTLWSNVNKTTFLVRSCTLEVGTKYHGGYMVYVVRWNIFEKTWCFLEIAIRSVWLRCIMGVEGREVNRGNIVTKFLWSKVKDLFFILRVLAVRDLSITHLKDWNQGGEIGWPFSWKWYHICEENSVENIYWMVTPPFAAMRDEGLSLPIAGHSPRGVNIFT